MIRYTGVESAVINGLGISETPSILCGHRIQDGSLVEVMPEWQFSPVTLSAIYPSNRNMSRLVRLFRDFCVEHIETLALPAKFDVSAREDDSFKMV